MHFSALITKTAVTMQNVGWGQGWGNMCFVLDTIMLEGHATVTARGVTGTPQPAQQKVDGRNILFGDSSHVVTPCRKLPAQLPHHGTKADGMKASQNRP